MADLELADPPPFAVVFVAFNTFFNLGTATSSSGAWPGWPTCSRPAAVFVLEAFVPADAGDTADRHVGRAPPASRPTRWCSA